MLCGLDLAAHGRRKRGVMSEPKSNFEEDATDDTQPNSIFATVHTSTPASLEHPEVSA